MDANDFYYVYRVPNIRSEENGNSSKRRLHKFFIVSFLMTTMMTSTLAAPSPYLMGANYGEPKEILSSFSFNPCGVIESNKGSAVVKHGEKGPLRDVITQLKNARDYYTGLNETWITKHYKSWANLQFTNRGVPNKQYLDYARFKKDNPRMANDQMTRHMLQKIHKSLLQFGEVFKKLNSLSLNTQINDPLPDRKNKLYELRNNLKRVLCEVETSMNATNTSIMSTDYEVLPGIEKGWSREPDLTVMQKIDISVFLPYKTFVDDWHKIFREINNNKKGIKKRKIDANKKPKSAGKTNRNQNQKQKDKVGAKKRSTTGRKNIRHNKVAKG